MGIIVCVCVIFKICCTQFALRDFWVREHAVCTICGDYLKAEIMVPHLNHSFIVKLIRKLSLFMGCLNFFCSFFDFVHLYLYLCIKVREMIWTILGDCLIFRFFFCDFYCDEWVLWNLIFISIYIRFESIEYWSKGFNNFSDLLRDRNIIGNL